MMFANHGAPDGSLLQVEHLSVTQATVDSIVVHTNVSIVMIAQSRPVSLIDARASGVNALGPQEATFNLFSTKTK